MPKRSTSTAKDGTLELNMLITAINNIPHNKKTHILVMINSIANFITLIWRFVVINPLTDCTALAGLPYPYIIPAIMINGR